MKKKLYKRCLINSLFPVTSLPETLLKKRWRFKPPELLTAYNFINLLAASSSVVSFFEKQKRNTLLSCPCL